MEAIFYAIVEITAEDLEDSEEEEEEEGVFRRLVKSASQLALNSMPRFMRKRIINTGEKRLSIDTTAFQKAESKTSIAKIFLHQGKTIIGGLSSIYWGAGGRSSWDLISRFTFHWIRNTLQYSGHNIHSIRKGEAIGKSLMTHVPGGVQITEMEFTINRPQLLSYEQAGTHFQQQTEAWRYPVPQEYPKSDIEVYNIFGEWVHPDGMANYDPITGFRSFSTSHQSKWLSSPKKVVLYLHGGAYILGSAKLYRPLTALLAKEIGHPVFAIDYRKAPEHPFPAGLHDALAAYLFLMNPKHSMFGGSKAIHEPYRAEDIIISGDSAGGGLVMALLNYLNMYLRKQDGTLLIPLPKAAVLFSPWLDLSCSSKSWQENSGLDFLPANASNLHVPILPNLQHPVYSYCFGERGGRYIDLLSPKSSKPISSRIPSIGANLSGLALPIPLLDLPDESILQKDQEWIQTSLRAEERDGLERFVRHPLVSPIFGDFSNLPPLLVQVGECELLRDENLALGYRYALHNNKSTHTSWIRSEVYKDMPHNFQLGSIWIPQAKLAIRSFSSFVGELFCGGRNDLALTFEEQKLITIIESRVAN